MNVLTGIPHFSTNPGGQGFIIARSGNYVWRYYNLWDDSQENKGEADVPLFKIDEVLLNYAEAKYELGQFDQGVADITINRLRTSFGKLPALSIGDLTVDYIPEWLRGTIADPVLWEIRRERIVELMGEGFGFYDIRRWKCAEPFVNHVQYGQWATTDQIGTSNGFIDMDSGFTDITATEGYIYMYNDPLKAGLGWMDSYYLYQVPTNEVALNPSLLPNNPGW